MNIFTVSLFGHRKIDCSRQLSHQLTLTIQRLVQEKPYTSFLIGRNGEFDEYAASLIKCVQKDSGNENSDMTLVLPYTVASIEDYEKYYDNVIIFENVYGVHPKSAITLKNWWMVERSDLVIVYVEHDKGGAYTAMKYAKKLNKDIINLSIKNYSLCEVEKRKLLI